MLDACGFLRRLGQSCSRIYAQRLRRGRKATRLLFDDIIEVGLAVSVYQHSRLLQRRSVLGLIVANAVDREQDVEFVITKHLEVLPKPDGVVLAESDSPSEHRISGKGHLFGVVRCLICVCIA